MQRIINPGTHTETGLRLSKLWPRSGTCITPIAFLTVLPREGRRTMLSPINPWDEQLGRRRKDIQ